MTTKQNGLYFRLWGAARRALRARGISPADADAWRKKIHEDVCGEPISSKKLNNRQLDLVFACFKSIASPDDDDFQLRQIEQPLIRMRWVAINAAEKQNKPPEYVESIAQHMFQRSLELCNAQQLRKIIAALTVHRKRIARRV